MDNSRTDLIGMLEREENYEKGLLAVDTRYPHTLQIPSPIRQSLHLDSTKFERL